MFPPRSAFLVASMTVLLALGAPGQAQDSRPQGGGWPFGGGEGPRGGGRDLYNLGILGAKASDADRAEAGPPTEGKKEVKVEADPTADVGPDRLKIALLYPEGPAQKAGLRPGDIVVGVNGVPFKAVKGGSLAPLAEAILKAEAGSTKGVSLLVDREGKGHATALLVPVPVLGKEALVPTKGKGRAAILAASLDWLARRQQEDGGYPSTLAGTTGAVVQTSMAGLAWLAGGSDLKAGPHAANVRKSYEFVAANMGRGEGGAAPSGGANWNQENWGFAHGAIFLGELQARSPDEGVRSALRAAAEGLATRQEKSGGWAHGPGGPNALGYVELNIVSGLSMMGMGLAKMDGWEPPAAVLAKARKYLEDSSAGDGGIGYSTSPGQKGQGNIGRTAAAWMGYAALGLGKDPWTRKMARWAEQHAGEVFGGHASLMEHFQLSGIAVSGLGPEAAKNYWAAAETSFVLASAPDGSFQPRPWHESLSMGSNSDVSFGEVWTTASWACVLACVRDKDGPPGLPATAGRR